MSNINFLNYRTTAIISCLAGMFLLVPVTHGSTDLEEVVVTSTKRSETISDAPLAVSVKSADFLQRANLNDTKDLIKLTPGITGDSFDSFIDLASIRGIRTQDYGIGSDPSIGFFKNDLYEGRNGVAITSLYDMERSEVVRGPQDFLFGRNAIAGAVSVHTRKAALADRSTAYLNSNIAERGHLQLDGAVNIPITSSFAVRLAGYSASEDGYVTNSLSDEKLYGYENLATRISTTFQTERLSLDTMLEYEDRESSGSVYRAITEGDIWDEFNEFFPGIVTPLDDARAVASDLSNGSVDEGEIATIGINAEYELGAFTLFSNTGYKTHNYFYVEDYDATELNINDYVQNQNGNYLQQEIRIASDTANRFSWYVGASYYRENIDTAFNGIASEDVLCNFDGNSEYPGEGITDCASLYEFFEEPWTPSSDGKLQEPGLVSGKYHGWSTYADFNYLISQSLDVSLGIRHTSDTKEFNVNVPIPESEYGPAFVYGFSTDGFIENENDWSNTSVRAILRYQPNDNSTYFLSYTEGYKAGGFGSFALEDEFGDRIGCCETELSQADGIRSPQFNPEEVASWEVGYKTEPLESVYLSINGFYYDYDQLQVSFFDEDSVANSIANLGRVEGHGIETELNANFSEYWELYLSLAWLDTEATGLQRICDGETSDACEGERVYWAPKVSGAAGVYGSYPLNRGELNSSLEAFWESQRGGGWSGIDGTFIDSYYEVSLAMDYISPNDWSAGLYVENLNNAMTYDGVNINGGVLVSSFIGPNRPRTFGLRFQYRWH